MYVLLSSVLIDVTGKISKNRPEMAREDTEGRPNVDRTLTERQALVALRCLGVPRGALTGSYQMFFFSGEEKCSHFFLSIGATVDFEKCCKMRLFLLS